MVSRTFRRVTGRTPLTSVLAMAVVGGLVVTVGPAVASTPQPTLTPDRVIHTTPFAGSNVSMRDDEGSAYVPRDNSLWLVDDDSHRIYEVNPSTGALKKVIDKAALSTVTKFGGGPQAGPSRSGDLESMAYDAATDTLYAFSGVTGVGSLPTAFRLKRRNGALSLVDYQPLPAGSDFTGAAWNSAERKVYVGVKHDLRTYDYATNKPGPVFQIGALNGIQGLDFSADGSELYVARRVITSGLRRLTEVDWSSKSVSWSVDLSPFGVEDARGVALINGSFYIADGSDTRPVGDPLDDAVFIFGGGPATPVVDLTAPQATLTRATSARSSVASWRVLKGRASDAGSGVDRVLLRIVEKRGAAWFAYRAPSHTWVKAGATRARAMKLSRLAAVAPVSTGWSYRVANLRKGHLVVAVSARDLAGNVSNARVYEQTLTR